MTPLGRDCVVTVSCAIVIAMLSCAEALCGGVSASVTVAVKLKVPAEPVGIPEMTPVLAFKVSPPGNDPPLIDHEYGVTPPVAASVSSYPAPKVPPGSD